VTPGPVKVDEVNLNVNIDKTVDILNEPMNESLLVQHLHHAVHFFSCSAFESFFT